MSNGLLGKAMAQVGQYVTVYTAPPDVIFTTASINIVNMDQSADAKVKIAVTDQAAATAVDHIDFGSTIPQKGGILERTCFLLSPGEKVMVESDNANVAIRVYGLEEVPVTN